MFLIWPAMGVSKSKSKTNGKTKVLTSKKMSFEDCNILVQKTIDQTGSSSITIVNTKILKMVKMSVADGDMLFTCSQPDQQLTVTLTEK